ncbi:MAG: tripartite tricarboxylate transporter substrate binding protein [Burkholderiaceae bacterium]
MFSPRLVLAATLLVLPWSAAVHASASYPAKPIRMIVPFPAGGATDILSRELARQLSDQLKQQVVVDNKPGAGGMLGAAEAARATPDGYTILLTTSSTHTIGPYLNPKTPYKPQADFTPVAHIADSASVIVVAPSLPVKSIKDLIDFAKKQPGKLNYGSSGNGTIVHLGSELFKASTGTDLTHIPYRGTALIIPDMVGGQIHLLVDNIASAKPHIRDGRVKALAVTSAQRSPLMPELPTVAETVPGFESVTWFGIFGPKNLPAAVVSRLNHDLNTVLRSTSFQERLRTLGYDGTGGSPEDFVKLMERDAAKWSKLIKDRGITLE